MYRRGRAFTLAELLTVLAIVAVMAGLLFPVFASATGAARRAKCISNFSNAHLAASMYMSDYDDYFMPVNHRPGSVPNARLDRTWVQLVLPYARSFAIFTCPSDSGAREAPETSFDQDLVPGDIYSQYYTASMHVNTGYNYLYLAPIVSRRGEWVSEPRQFGAVADPSRTLLFADSIWNRNQDGVPIGGGNWLVVPPCRYSVTSNRRVDSFAVDGNVFAPIVGWNVTDPRAGNLYGNAWPWHNGRVNIGRVDGSVKSISPGDLAAGCTVEDRWRGTIRDDSYFWDLR